MRPFAVARLVKDWYSARHLRVAPPGKPSSLARLVSLFLLLVGGGCTGYVRPPDTTIPPNCYISGRKDLNVVFANETPSKAVLYDGRDWAKIKFASANLDLAAFDGSPEPPSLPTYVSGCDGIYDDNNLSIQHCGAVADSVLRRYARSYRNDAANIINTYTFTSTPYLYLYVDFPVYMVDRSRFLIGRSFYSNVVAAGVSYGFDAEQERFLDGASGIPGYNVNQRLFYKKNSVKWSVAHELGHLFSDLTDANLVPLKHNGGVLRCIMRQQSQSDIVPGFLDPDFDSDADSDTLNTCVDNLATYFHLRTCSNP